MIANDVFIWRLIHFRKNKLLPTQQRSKRIQSVVFIVMYIVNTENANRTDINADKFPGNLRTPDHPTHSSQDLQQCRYGGEPSPRLWADLATAQLIPVLSCDARRSSRPARTVEPAALRTKKSKSTGSFGLYGSRNALRSQKYLMARPWSHCRQFWNPRKQQSTFDRARAVILDLFVNKD